MIGILLLSSQVAPPLIDPTYRKHILSLVGPFIGDPRDSHYCRVTVMAERPYPAGYAEVEVVGFVNDSDPKSAVLWDGLRYPIKRVLGPASLERAQRACQATTQWPSARCTMAGLGPKKPQYGFDLLMGNPAAPALWMLIGEERTAAKLLARQSTWSSMIMQDSVNRLEYWIADRLRSRFFELFHNGEDRLALSCVEKEIQLHLEPKWNREVGRNNTPEELLTEVRRRMAKPEVPPSALPDDEASIIQSLEHIKSLPNSSPSYDPIFDNAAKKGSSLVPALLAARSHDSRLTRAQVPSRNFSDYSLAKVSDVADILVQTIWPEFVFVKQKTEAEILATWHKIQGLPRLDQMVVFLEDETLADYYRLAAFEQLGPHPQLRSASREREARIASARMQPRIVAVVRPIVENQLNSLNETSSNQEKTRALDWIAAFASWNWDLGQSYQARAVQLLPELLKRDAPVLEKVQKLLLSGMDHGDAGSFLMYETLTEHFDGQGDESRLALPILRFSKHAEVREILARYGAAFGSQQNPALAIDRLNDVFQRNVLNALANSDFRGFLTSALENKSEVAVHGVPPYLYPNRPGESSTDSTFRKIRVCDHAAYLLCHSIETGCALDFRASLAIRDRTCAQVKAWLKTLADKKRD